MALSPQQIVPLHLADMTFPDFHPLAGQQGQVFGFVVRHPDGIVLVDTGVGWGSQRIDEAYQPVHRQIEDALAGLGIGLGDVAAVVNTHLHFDHCGGNRQFPSVPIYVQRADYEATQMPRFTIPEWVDFPGARYELLSGEATILAGVKVIPTPGHTPGHQSVVVDTSEGPIVIAGQAIYSGAEYAHIRDTGQILPGDPQPDPNAYLASARRLIELRPRRIYFSHDPIAVDQNL